MTKISNQGSSTNAKIMESYSKESNLLREEGIRWEFEKISLRRFYLKNL